MQIQRIKLSELVPDPRNTRVHDEKNIGMIMKSLDKFGQYRAMVVQKQGMIIRVGNGMYEAMKRLGWEEGECEVRDISDDEAKVLSILDNKSSDLSFFDDSKLVKTLNNLSSSFLDLAGFSKTEINSDKFTMTKKKNHFSKPEAPFIFISFENDDQLAKWKMFESYLCMKYPDGESKLTMSERFAKYFVDVGIVKEDRLNDES